MEFLISWIYFSLDDVIEFMKIVFLEFLKPIIRPVAPTINENNIPNNVKMSFVSNFLF